MAEVLMSVEVSEPAEIAYSALGVEDQRRVDAWFDHLRNWRNDEFIRSKSRRLNTDKEIYAFQTGSDIILAFQIAGDKVIVLSIFRKESLRGFEAVAGQETR